MVYLVHKVKQNENVFAFNDTSHCPITFSFLNILTYKILRFIFSFHDTVKEKNFIHVQLDHFALSL